MTSIPSYSYASIYSQPSGCSMYMYTAHFTKCEGEMNGRIYRWGLENPIPNYVLFRLSRRASISEVNLTYSVDSTSEMPKVSFCAAPDNTIMDYYFPNLTCQEVSIEATGGDIIATTLHTPFTNITNSIVMKVTTNGIKASLKVSAVQFSGFYVATGEYTYNFTYLSVTIALHPDLPKFLLKLKHGTFIGLRGLH